MSVVFEDEAALQHLDSEIVKAEEAANAEKAYRAANAPGIPNPWQNAERKLADLLNDREQLALRLKGHALTKAHEELRRLDEELSRAQAQREAADHALHERKEHETVKRYLGATSTCMKLGWGPWSAFFRPWYESGKPRYIAANEQAVFFLDSPLAQDAGVQFDLGAERDAVKLYVEAQEAANKALTHWCSLAEQKSNLLREHPELKVAS